MSDSGANNNYFSWLKNWCFQILEDVKKRADIEKQKRIATEHSQSVYTFYDQTIIERYVRSPSSSFKTLPEGIQNLVRFESLLAYGFRYNPEILTRELHRLITATLLPIIMGEDFGRYGPDVLNHIQFHDLCPIKRVLLVDAPRRSGKTTPCLQAVAALFLAVPKISIIMVAQNLPVNKNNVQIVREMLSFLAQDVHLLNPEIDIMSCLKRCNQEGIAVEMMKGGDQSVVHMISGGVDIGTLFFFFCI